MENELPESASRRARLVIAAVAAIILAGIVVAVVALGGDEFEQASAPPVPPSCTRAWNGDPAATSYGRHNFNFHRYTAALVTFITSDAEQVDDGEGGMCAVVFPAKALDPEPFAAGQVLRGDQWFPISSLPRVNLAVVADLQAEAATAPNAPLDTTGKLSAG